MSSPCRCVFRDWKGLRHALGLTQAQLGFLLSLRQAQVARMESTNPKLHACHTARTLRLLRYELQEPERLVKLAKAGYPHPFPLDGPEGHE